MDFETETEIGLIYLLKDKTEKCYVGKTNDIKRRIYLHDYDIKNQRGCSSRLLDIDFTYEVLEDNIENELLDLREQYWYDFYREKCGELLVNKCRPLNDTSERKKIYRANHKDITKDQMKQYYITHKTEYRERDRKYKLQNKDKLKEKAINRTDLQKKEHSNYQKKYREKNKETLMKTATEKIDCECGGKYIKSHKSSHFKTKKHIDFCGN